MQKDTELEWMRDYLDGRIDEAGLKALEMLLESDAGARKRFLSLSAMEEGLRDLAALPLPTMGGVVAEPGGLPWIRRFIRRPLAAAAAGLVIGIFAATAVGAYMAPFSPRAVALLRDGFEVGPPPEASGMPEQTGRWSGDRAEVVGTRQEVVPANGRRMLQFLRADYDGKETKTGSHIADLYRLIDVREHRGIFGGGLGHAIVAAQFNSIEFPDSERYLCSVSIYALSESMVMHGGLKSSKSGVRLLNESQALVRERGTELDRDAGTWQTVETELKLPPKTDFLMVRMGVAHATAGQKRLTFDGQFVDDVRVALMRREPLRNP